ncbi:peptide deformylase 1A, chloroplastic [Artemisia annua]|uniref:Peptide deformylase n=1 Tax=Artemisia annua TaxID=35608 RepID=A0A2U1Q9U6_ARTAN|nr:peptide deformylase 1A, chloroplastic [Artemisia annua]
MGNREKRALATFALFLALSLHALFESENEKLPLIVNVGDPILHQPAREVYPEEIWSKHVQKTIDDMVKVMRKEGVASLSAPQIGVPIKIIVLEDTKLYMAPSPDEVNEKQDRHPSDLLVIVNPKLRNTSYETTQFFEDVQGELNCLNGRFGAVTGHLAKVKRFLKVEVTGLDRNGQPIKVDASGWQARILQHACDHLEGILFVDKLVKRH